MSYRKRNIAKGIAAGLAGGLVATLAMTEFQNIWSKAAEMTSSNGHSREQSSDEENPTGKTADAISNLAFGKNLSKQQKQKAGPFVHYTFGTLMGGVYGAAAELSPVLQKAAGLPFGTALFLGADELVLPVLKLTKGPAAYPVSRHIYGLSSHLVWAVTAELVRRVVRTVI